MKSSIQLSDLSEATSYRENEKGLPFSFLDSKSLLSSLSCALHLQENGKNGDIETIELNCQNVFKIDRKGRNVTQR